MIRPTEVKAQGYGLRLRYEDGAEGTLDLSDFAGRGVFEAWNDAKVFQGVPSLRSAPVDA